jgi:hypothetical protein
MFKNYYSSKFTERCVISENITKVHFQGCVTYILQELPCSVTQTDVLIISLVDFLGRSRINSCGDNDKLTQVLNAQFLGTVIYNMSFLFY